jgi:phosphatidate phosphatase LPIN
MQYVRSISGSVSKTWNSINPATLSGAIDVVVVEQEDGQTYPQANCSNPELTCIRIFVVFSFPCTVREVLIAETIREEGEGAFYMATILRNK